MRSRDRQIDASVHIIVMHNTNQFDHTDKVFVFGVSWRAIEEPTAPYPNKSVQIWGRKAFSYL